MPFFSIILCITMLSCFCHLIMSTVAFICHSMCHRAVYFGFLIMCNAVIPYHSLCHHAFMFLSPYYEHCRFSLSLCVTVLSYFCFLIMSNAVFLYHSLCLLIMSTVAFLFHCMFHRAVICWFSYYVQCRFSLSFSVSPCFHGFVTLL